jgi:hypothetical protein
MLSLRLSHTFVRIISPADLIRLWRKHQMKWVRLLWNDDEPAWNQRVELVKSVFDVDLEPGYENSPGASTAIGYLDWADSACNWSTV